MRTETVAGSGITLDLLLWRAYGRAGNTSAMLAAAWALNPGLAAKGPVLPLGARVTLPDPPSPAAARRRVPVNLFDD